ncbi:hypothetical protein BG015_009410 [Linnemannia schmuckeri]|uniref:Uncharacterized protein n=1 Tax=Linnemannia schmuckeri TaxID=64567 RepID=A0A9P5RVK1_9FUNG|nr:hypothetical protein BG015_009410 [Linnemannia schmuckeri]
MNPSQLYPGSTTYSAFPRPTSGSGSGNGGPSTEDDVAAVAAALPLKILIPIIAGALFIGSGMLYELINCCIRFYMICKDIINGEVPSRAVVSNDLVIPTKRGEKAAGTGAGDLTYPVKTEH